jgi:hypothetical protein
VTAAGEAPPTVTAAGTRGGAMPDSPPVSLASTDPAAPPAPEPPPEVEPPAPGRLSSAGRRWRLVATVVPTLLLLAGTLWGSDDHFPFGPFRMYANANEPDGLVRSSRVEAVNAEGERFKLTDAATGLRRAEIEGQLGRFRRDPSRLQAVAQAYEARHPDAPRLLLVEVLQRRYRLEDGQPTGRVTEHQIAAWAAPGHEELADYEARQEAENR